MNSDQPQSMANQPQKKRMSKGCLVALIVVGVLLIMVAVAAITCWMKKDDLVKYGVVQLVGGIAEMAQADPQPGVDPDRLENLAGAFEERINAVDSVDFQQLGMVAQQLQPIAQDETIDSTDARKLYEVVFDIFPDMRDQYAPPGMTALEGPLDTIVVNKCKDDPENADYWRQGINLLSDPALPTKEKTGEIPGCDDAVVDVLEKKVWDGVEFYRVKYGTEEGWQTKRLLTGQDDPLMPEDTTMSEGM